MFTVRWKNCIRIYWIIVCSITAYRRYRIVKIRNPIMWQEKFSKMNRTITPPYQTSGTGSIKLTRNSIVFDSLFKVSVLFHTGISLIKEKNGIVLTMLKRLQIWHTSLVYEHITTKHLPYGRCMVSHLILFLLPWHTCLHLAP